MVNELGIIHETSSPKHPKSHGFIECMVQTTKSLIKNVQAATNKALLAYHTTPGPGMSSPAELLFNRKISNNLLIKATSFANEQYRTRKALQQKKVEEHTINMPRTIKN